MAEKSNDMAMHEKMHAAERQPSAGAAGPLRMLERFAQDVDRVFEEFGLGPRTRTLRSGHNWSSSPWRSAPFSSWNEWTPDIDVFQRNHEIIVRADLPGLRKEDIRVDVTDNAVSIHGERAQEVVDERAGIYTSERGYGSFSRIIPLPEGTITDQAKATFNNGVLEITMPTPPEQVTRGRRLEISETSPKKG